MPRALALALALVAAPAVARADGPWDSSGTPKASTGWVDAHVGLTFADSLTLGSSQAMLDSNGTPGMVFGVGAHWRTSRIDLGLLFESISSFYFLVLDRDFPTGGEFRAAANLRWRYIEDSWGALYMRLSPGIMGFRHSDQVRQQAATLANGNLEDVDTHSVGFSLGFDFGVLLYLGPKLALAIDLDVVSGTSSLDLKGGSLDYGVVRGLITVGFEWGM